MITGVAVAPSRQVREEEAEKARARLERAEAVIEQERAARVALERRLAQQQSAAAAAAAPDTAVPGHAAAPNGSAPSTPRSTAASPVASATGVSLRRQVRLLVVTARDQSRARLSFLQKLSPAGPCADGELQEQSGFCSVASLQFKQCCVALFGDPDARYHKVSACSHRVRARRRAQRRRSARSEVAARRCGSSWRR